MRSILVFSLLTPAPVLGAQLPPPVYDMVKAAADSGEKAKIDAVVAIAKQTNKGSEAEIDKIVADVSAARAAAATAAPPEKPGLFDNWKGNAQLGAALSTGNTEMRSITTGLSLERSAAKWRHRANASVDLVDNRDGQDQERILAGYQLDYRFSNRAYTWGRFEYERNREAGIKRRFAESAGLGWRVIDGRAVRWDLEAGPAVRQTIFLDYTENSMAGRGASRFAWKLSEATSLSSDSSIFVDGGTSLNTTLSLTAKMFGSVGARFSYNLVWEEDPPIGLESLDTTTRITLIYEF